MIATIPERARNTDAWLEEALLNVRPGERVHATGIPWSVYTRLADFRDENHSGIRITFDQGSMELMSPKYRHEKPTLRLARVVVELARAFRHRLLSARSTTFQQEQAEKGLEPDDCFYIANANAIRGLEDIDLTIHPPPDLAIEVDSSRSSVPKEPIYASMGVPELWRHDKGAVTIRLLGEDKHYTTSQTSKVFPIVSADRLTHVLYEAQEFDDLEAEDHFHAWASKLAGIANP